MSRMRQNIEDEKKRVKSTAEHAKNLGATLKSCFGYLVIFLFLLVLGGPPLVINMVKNKIAKGEWTHLEQAPADVVMQASQEVIKVTKKTS